MTADEARLYLSRLSNHPNRRGDTDFMNPEFAIRLATAIQQARAEGIPATLFSGYRDDYETGKTYDERGFSSHGYGLAADVGGIGPMGSRTALRWSQIAEANGIHNPYGQNSAAEYNHWQLPPQPLERTPELLASLRAARANGPNAMWAAYTPQSAGGGAGRYTSDQVFNAILQQESGGQDIDNPMQIQPALWSEFAQPGENIHDRATNLAVGHRIINAYMDKYGDDPGKVAVAYFSGPGNVASSGSSAFIKDSADKNGKTVSSYMNDILRRVGAPGAAGAPAVAQGGQGAGQTQAAPDPWAQTRTALSAALGQMANEGSNRVSGAPDIYNDASMDQPAIRSPALMTDAGARDAVPAPGGSVGSMLAGITPQFSTIADPMQYAPSITSGAGMSALVNSPVGTSYDPTLADPRRVNTINPYAAPLTRLG